MKGMNFDNGLLGKRVEIKERIFEGTKVAHKLIEGIYVGSELGFNECEGGPVNITHHLIMTDDGMVLTTYGLVYRVLPEEEKKPDLPTEEELASATYSIMNPEDDGFYSWAELPTSTKDDFLKLARFILDNYLPR